MRRSLTQFSPFFIQGFRRKKLPYRLDDIFVYGHSGAFEFGSVFFRNESVPNITFTFIIGILNSGAFLVATMTYHDPHRSTKASAVECRLFDYPAECGGCRPFLDFL